MILISYAKLTKDNLDLLDELKNDAKIKQFIHVSDSFKDYLLSSKSITYYYIFAKKELIGGLYIEINKQEATFSIEVKSEFRQHGIGGQVLKDLQSDKFELNVVRLKATVEKCNYASLALFRSSKFIELEEEDGLIVYEFKFSKGS